MNKPRRRLAVACCLLLALCCSTIALAQRDPRKPASPDAAAPTAAATEDGLSVYFSPNGGALAALVQQIDAAKTSIDVQAYMLTTKDIAGPLKAAHDRGVKVRVLMDADNAATSYSAATYFANAGMTVFTDAEHKEAHDKVMILDGATLITGSFNFTKAADEQNAENLLVITDKPKLLAAYQANFEKHLEHAKPYVKP